MMRKHQREHPVLTTALFITVFFPVIPLMIAVGRLLRSIVPYPAAWHILLALPVFILTIVIGIWIGALIFLLIAKRFVKKELLEPHCIYPGVPVASQLFAGMFRWAYRA
jgi:uncharacterized membrane protein